MAKLQDMVLTIAELAEYSNPPKSTLYHLARCGDCQDQKIGRHSRFNKAAVKRPVVDTRTPEQLLDIIEAKGREVAESLAKLRQQGAAG